MTAFSAQHDFLAAALEFSVNEIISVVLDLDDKLTEKITGAGMDEDSMLLADHQVIESVYRIFAR